MTRDELVAEIRNKLGYNQGLSESYITDALNNAQDLLEQEPELPWFLESEVSTISATSGEERVRAPSDYIRSVPENALWFYDATADPVWQKIERKNLADLRELYNSEWVEDSVTKPQAYALQGYYIRLFPTPASTYTLKWLYYKKLEKLTAADATNGWSTEAPYMLVGKAGMLLASNIKDEKLEAKFNRIYKDAAIRIGITSEAREHADVHYVRGGAD